MATCIVDITADIASGDVYSYPLATTGVSIPIVFSPSSKAKVTITTSKQETIVCNLSVVNSGNITATFFKVNDDGLTVTNMGGVSTSDNTTIFQKDVTPGTYHVCFASSTVTTDATFTCFFSGFVSETRLHARGYAGEALIAELKISKRERFCNEPMTFEFVSGELPPGCELQSDGSIRGKLPDLDCIDENGEFSPSVNWFYEDSEEGWRPIPRRWLFRARVRLVNYPYVTAEENFSIDVHNDWTKDRDAFMKDAEKGFDRETMVEVVSQPAVIDKNQFVTQPDTTAQAIEEANCPVCGNSDLNKDAEFVSWYVNDYQTDSTATISAFIEKFKTTNKFKQLESALKGTADSESVINNIITESLPDDGMRSLDDIDYMFLSVGRKLNMKLPTESIGYSGEHFEAKLDG